LRPLWLNSEAVQIAEQGAKDAGMLFDLCGSPARAEEPAAALPHGDERKLGVARALATEPRFVLLDEPHGTKETGGLALAGLTTAPLAGRVISRIAPLLGVPQRPVTVARENT